MSFGKEPEEGKFIIRRTGKFSDLEVGTEVQESDLFIVDNNNFLQAEYIESDTEASTKYEAEPGTYNIGYKGQSLALNAMEMRTRKLLTTYDNTKQIMAEAELFFRKVDEGMYAKLEKDPKRAILLYSGPGFGKTSAIAQVCSNFKEQDPKTIVINWPTSEIRSSDATRFMAQIKYIECSRLIFIIEDIGGGEKEHHGGERGIDSSLLNLLDGTDVTFPIPTFIIATTNHPGNLLDALADRPGRFDEMIELDPPSLQERIDLVTFMSKRALADEEKEALKKAENFSVAHLSEIVERSLLKDKTYAQVIDDLINHKSKFSKNFEKQKKGMSLRS